MSHGTAPRVYRIRIEGQLREQWASWLGGALITLTPDSRVPGQTIVMATVPDQAALRGILNKLWDLNLTLLSISALPEMREGEHKNDKVDAGSSEF